MKEDKMENIHLIFKFLWYSVLFCIWGVSCTSSGTYKVSIRPRACFSPSYNKVKSQTKHVWLLTLL